MSNVELIQVDDPGFRERLVALVDRILAATPDGFLMHGKQINAGVRADRTDAVMWHHSDGHITIQRSTYPGDSGSEYAIGRSDDDGACTELVMDDRNGLQFRSSVGVTASDFLGWLERRKAPTEEFGPNDESRANWPADTPGILTTTEDM